MGLSQSYQGFGRFKIFFGYRLAHGTGTRQNIEMKIGRYFLAKTDPETYSIDDLERDRQTVWDGVKNAQALRAIREMKAGDRVFIYHSMGDACIVGMAEITADGRPDPKDPRLVVADFRFRNRVEPPVTLKEIKESGEFADWALVKQSRLSTMEAPEKFVKWMRELRPKAKI
jgi:predicted RNA-binding protein with PUA-like domain